MAESQKPLLSKERIRNEDNQGNSLLHTSANWVSKALMWAIFITWAASMFFFPSEFFQNIFTKWINLTNGTVFGITGSIFLGFSGPILLIAFLGFLHIIIFSRDDFKKEHLKPPKFRLWTFPVFVNGPFGVISAAEVIGILLFSIYVIGSVIYCINKSYHQVQSLSMSLILKSSFLLEVIGLRLGSIGLFCMVFLFLPVARGSILLRLVDIPFEHATRYHVWLGHLTMVLFTLHGFFFVVVWALEGKLLQNIFEWQAIGVANLPGVISLIAGLLMWATSFHTVRKYYFELFFYTHQLYVIFVVFLAFHVGDFVFSIAAGAIFIFMLDRFLRFCQSRNEVDVISAACRPCGTVELVLSKPSNLRYNALSFIFVQIRELSWLQWHPFSVSSSPLDGNHHISVLIKVLGGWTENLRNVVSDTPDNKTQLSKTERKITACVEGPYGHESPYHLMYENLILVAGGIGISPFLAILSDILHRIKENKPCLTRKVLIVWAVKKSKELSLLSAVNAELINSDSDDVCIEIQTFVTQESEPSLEEGTTDGYINSVPISLVRGKSMSCLVGTGDNMWSGLYFILSTFGFITFYGLVEKYYIKPNKITTWWYMGLLFIICMVLGVVILGGIVIFLWHKWGKICASSEKCVNKEEKASLMLHMNDEANRINLAKMQTLRYGCRPDFEAIFNSFSEKVGHANIGVIVCGPAGLQCSVAKECRSQNMKAGKWTRYENPILVAGGIGVSPFLAILSDIVRRIKENKSCLPRKVLVVWTVKKIKGALSSSCSQCRTD